MSPNSVDPLLVHWTHSLKPNEHFKMLTQQLLETAQNAVIGEQESRLLEKLLKQNQSELVYRYLDLQLFYRMDPESTSKHLAIEMEHSLEDSFKNPEESPLRQIVALRSMEKLLGDFLASLGGNRKAPKRSLSLSHFGSEMKALVGIATKESPGPLLEDFFEHAEESLEYWNRICVQLEQLLLWQGAVEELYFAIETIEQKSDSPSDLERQCAIFEKELASFSTHLQKLNLQSAFSQKTGDALKGRIKKWLRKLNTAYGHKKSALMGRPCDVHICCGCDLSQDTTNKSVLDFSSLKGAIDHKTTSEKSLLIFTCAGGMGHLSVAKAMSEYAIGKYHIEVANTLEDTLASTDLFKRLLFNFSQERLYNYLLRKEEFEWLKMLTSVGLFFFLMQQESLEKQIRLEVLRKSPDLLISCFPCLNPMFLNIAKELDLPLLMVTTDLDTNLYTKGMNGQTCDLSYPKWKMTLAYDTAETRAVIEKRIPKNKIHVSGFPIRPGFQKPASDLKKESLYKQFGIAKGDRIALVMIGGVASQTTEKYAHLLAHLTDSDVDSLTSRNLHVICLCGNQKFGCNLEMRLKIDTLSTLSPRVRIHGIGAVEEMAPLMEIADVLITKPGGCSTSEALAKKLPMVFHAPFALMDWEVFNMEFCIEHKMGLRFKFQGSNLEKNKERLLPLLREALHIKDAPPDFPFAMHDFGQEFLKEVEGFLN